MKFKLSLLVFMSLFLALYSIKMQTLENAVNTGLTVTEGIDVIKILNLDKLKSIQNRTDIQEEEILKQKLKQSDIDNFENYLDAYLEVLRKFNKKNKISIIKKHNRSYIYQNKSKSYKEIKLKNKTIVDNKNGSKVTKNLSIIKNDREYQNNLTILPIKSEIKPIFISNTTIKKKNINTTSSHIKFNRTVFNESTKINNFLLGYSTTSNNSSLITEKNKVSDSNSTNSLGNNNTFINDFKYNTNNIRNDTKKDLHTKYNISLNESKNNFTNIKLKRIAVKSTIGNSKPEFDQIYENLKKNKLNQDFERREMSTETKKTNKFLENETEILEKNIYKRIVNISLSLILVGLLMGILLGLILVMYFTTKNK